MRTTTALLTALVIGVQPAWATMNNARPPGYASAPPAPSADRSKAMADDSSGLRSGTLDRIDVHNGVMTLHGQSVTFDAAHVRIFDGRGRPMRASELRAGARIRFSLDPADTRRRRAAVIYVD